MRLKIQKVGYCSIGRADINTILQRYYSLYNARTFLRSVFCKYHYIDDLCYVNTMLPVCHCFV